MSRCDISILILSAVARSILIFLAAVEFQTLVLKDQSQPDRNYQTTKTVCCCYKLTFKRLLIVPTRLKNIAVKTKTTLLQLKVALKDS